MEKPAQPDYPILDVLERRWSPRAFAAKAVEPEKLRSIFEAVRWSASSYNEQPWVFFVARRQETELFEKILGCLVEGNRLWARQAPVLGLTATKTFFERNHEPNRVHQHDLGLAMGSLTAQAMALDLFVHQMAGLVPARVRAEFDLPEGCEPQTGFAIGYGGDPEQLPASLRDSELAPRTRKKQDEFVFGPRFGESATF
ncbi:MAG: nitroreductase family protein [Phycisphaeraceae bacterium]